MAYSIFLRPQARRDLKRLPANILKQVDDCILALAKNPRPAGSIKLSGSKNSYRIRVGNYRVLYEIRDKYREVCIACIRHRRDVYRKR